MSNFIVASPIRLSPMVLIASLLLVALSMLVPVVLHHLGEQCFLHYLECERQDFRAGRKNDFPALERIWRNELKSVPTNFVQNAFYAQAEEHLAGVLFGEMKQLGSLYYKRGMYGEAAVWLQKAQTFLATCTIEDRALSADLKQTADAAREASANVQKAMSELNKTVGDKGVRDDMQGMLQKIQASTDKITKSIQTVNKLAGDQSLRSDLKEVVTKANTALDKVNGLVSEPNFAVDVESTMEKHRN